jgi:hypothetical protein
LLFESVKGRIKGALLHGKYISGQFKDTFRDSPAVDRPPRDGFEDEQVQSSLKKIGWLGHLR